LSRSISEAGPGGFPAIFIPHAAEPLDIAGRELTIWLQELLTEGYPNLAFSSQRWTVRDIKENVDYVSLDFEAELRKPTQSDCIMYSTLSDGS
jgi:actin beta/gamma 1